MELASKTFTRSTATALAALLLTTFAHSDVWIVDATGGGDFRDLQAAVDAAGDGDTLVVRDGVYSTFFAIDKGLRVVAERGATPVVHGTVVVRDLSAGKEFVLSGLRVTASPSTDLNLVNGLILFNDFGPVRIQDCLLTGTYASIGPAGRGALLHGNQDVIFTRCTLEGGRGDEHYGCCAPGGTGAEGLRSVTSVVALYECEVIGGKGGYSGWGGQGGHGANFPNFGLFAASTTFRGGAGGVGDDFVYGPGGNGGDGLVVAAGAQAQLLDNVYVGGAGGISALFSPDQDGLPGIGLQADPGSLVVLLPGTARRFTSPPSAWEGGKFLVEVHGEPGDEVWYPTSRSTGFVFLAHSSGVWALFLPEIMHVEPRGVVGADGTLELAIHLPALPGGVEADLRYYQGRVVAASGEVFLGTPHALVRLGCGFSGDCDGSGTPDACEIQSGAVTDCNVNGIPDLCEVGAGVEDCNANGIADVCDIQSGFSLDCDGNGIADECEYDCNGNGIPDLCDVLSGTSADCDGNLVPDSCDVDCNGNGVADGCDILAGTSLDLDGNGVPDECQSPGDVYFVDSAGPPYGGDGSLGAPFDTIQKAIDYSISGNTLIVLDGTYTGPDNRNLDFGSRDLWIRSQNGPGACVIDCEGEGRAFLFDGGQTLASRLEGLTIRNGSSLGNAVDPERGGGILIRTGSAATLVDCVIEACEALRYGGGVFVSPTSDAVLEGCTLRANVAVGGSSQGMGGGGLSSFSFRSPSTGTLTLKGCAIIENTGFQGSGLMLGSGMTLVEDCLIESNAKTTFGFGGGIWHLGTGDATIIGCSILQNDGAFAAIHCESKGKLHVSHCVISGNTSTSLGGGVGVRNFFMPTLEATIEHCLISGNSAGSGGGIIAIDVPKLVVRDCTIVDNTAHTGGGLNISNVVDASFVDCILWGNEASFQAPSIRLWESPLTVDFCDVEGDLAGTLATDGGVFLWGPNNLDQDPAFVDPTGPDGQVATWDDNDYRLGVASPCVDAGDNAAVLDDVLDLDGNGDTVEPVPLDLDFLPRFVDDPLVADTGSGTPPLVDLGAYEKQ